MLPRPRLLEVDLMRATAVLCMIAVHAKMLFLHRNDARGPVGIIAELLGGAPAAPTFLFLMGLVWVLHPDRPWKAVIKRAIQIFLLGYLLNFLRLTLPLSLGAPFPPASPTDTFFMVDILQMAAPAMLILRALEKAPPPVIGIAAAIAGMAGISLWGTTPSPGPLDILWGDGAFVFFPLFPWLVYPLVGMLAARAPRKQRLLIGAAFLPAGLAALDQFKDGFTYYRSSPAQVLWMLGFVFLWREFAIVIAPRIPAAIQKAIAYLSQNVTSFYVFSWLILSWPVFLLGYRQRDTREYFVIYFITVVLSVTAVAIWRELRLAFSAKPAPNV